MLSRYSLTDEVLSAVEMSLYIALNDGINITVQNM